MITLNNAITNNAWHFAAVRWTFEENKLKCKLYLDGESFENTITDFKDFNYSKEVLSDEEINNLSKENGEKTTSHINIDYNYDVIGRLTS